MFNPSRLTLARKLRGWTKRKLAAAVGVTDRTVLFWEKEGEINPAEKTLPLVADALGFPISFFAASDLDEVPSDAVSFRALTKMTATQRNAALAAGSLALALSDWIEERFKTPEPDVPKLGPGIDPETAAGIIRGEWGLGEQPLPNMIHLLEAHGVRVFSLAEESREVDAFSFRRAETPFVFLNTIKSGEHRRMDAAHELGHLVLHWRHDGPQGREAEQEAQAFASALLMPRATISSSAPRFVTLPEVMSHKRHWQVSAMAYVYRLHKLELLSEWQYRTLNIEMSKRGYRTCEPKPRIQPETSQVLTKVFNALRKERLSNAYIASELDLCPADLAGLVFGLTMVPVTGQGQGGQQPQEAPKPFRLVQGGAS